MPQPSPLFYNPSLLTLFPQTHLVPFWALPRPPLRQPEGSLPHFAAFPQGPHSQRRHLHTRHPSVRSLPAPHALLFCLWCLHNKLLPNSVASNSHVLCSAIRTGHSAEGVSGTFAKRWGMAAGSGVGKAQARGWNLPKACFLTHQVVDASSWFKHPHMASPWGSGFPEYSGWVPGTDTPTE